MMDRVASDIPYPASDEPSRPGEQKPWSSSDVTMKPLRPAGSEGPSTFRALRFEIQGSRVGAQLSRLWFYLNPKSM